MKPEDFESLRKYCRDDKTFSQLLTALAGSVPGFAQDLPAAQLSDHVSQLSTNPFVTAFPGIVFVSANDIDRTLKYVSDDCLIFTGYRPADLLNNNKLSFRSLICPEDWPQAVQLIDNALTQQTRYSIEYRIRHQDGRQRWLLEKGTGLFDSDGQAIGVQGFITDITDKKQVEQALKLSQERYSLAVSAGGVGVWEWNLLKNTFYADAALRRMLGYTAHDPLNNFRDLIELIHPDDRSDFTEKVRGYLSGIEPEFELEHRIWHKNKSIQWFRTYGVVIRSVEGQPERLVCMGTDITRQREAELQIQSQAEQLRETLNSSRLLGAIAARIRKSLDLEAILNTTVAQVRQVFQTDRVMIYRVERPDAGAVVAHAWEPEWSVTEERLASYLDCLIHRGGGLDDYDSYCQGKTIAISNVDLQSYSSPQLKHIQKLRLRSKLVVPILQSSQLWGLLVVHQCVKMRQWQLSEVDLLEKLADQVAIAIQQAQLFQQVQQQAERERLLNELSRRLNTRLNPQQLLADIVQLTGETLRVDRAYIFSRGAQRAEVLAEWRAGQEVVAVSRLSSLITLLPKIVDPQDGFAQRRCFHAPNYAQVAPPEGKLLIERARTRSLLAAPVFIQGRLYGGLVLETTTQHRLFEQDEIRLLERISDQAAIALYNAQSYEYLEWQVQERTRELEAQKQISEAASQAKSRFLAVMSHELRTPLNSILGLSNLLGQEMFGQLNDKQREYISCIQGSGEHLRDLIGDILDLAKVESGREQLDIKKVTISELCNHCLRIMGERAEEKGLALTHHVDPEVTDGMADERRLRQMLLNLLSNAIKFTTEGEVSLQVQRQGNDLIFQVKDTGIGIEPADQEKLFEAFYQVDSELSRHYEGTGLGLALTRQLARLHGGDVNITSTVGEGSTFTITLPDSLAPTEISHSAEVHLPNSAQSSSGSVPTLGKRILIVEDDLKSAMLLKDYLQVLGYNVEHLGEADAFRQRVRQFKPQLILLDVKLENDINGLDLLTQLRQEISPQTLPVVIVSAQAMAEDRARSLALGANDYMSKPISIPKLELVLSKYL
ncbi:MAG: PAS domain-containing protein [Cyanobacteria bacterium J06554_6]